MQLCKETLDVLKNFSSINTNLVIREGSKIETISPSKNIMATYTAEDVFDTQVSIFNMNEFLGVLGAFESPNLELNDMSMTISQGKQKVDYIYADEKLLVTPPTKGITFPPADISFQLSDVVLSKLLKMSQILKAEDFAVIGDGEKLTLKVLDIKNPSCNAFEIDTECESSEVFQANFKIERLKLMPGVYDVEISSKKISRFSHTGLNLVYLIAVEQDSKF